MSLEIIKGNLLAAKEEYIGHQCNCVTKGLGAGLAKFLFRKFPYSNTYAARQIPNNPGTYSLHGNGRTERWVVNFYAQYHPGKPGRVSYSSAMRLGWLIRGLDQFVSDRNPGSFALPFGIGCGLAGGDWEIYHQALVDFCERSGIRLTLYKVVDL